MGTLGAAKCVLEILGVTKIRKLGGGTKFTLSFQGSKRITPIKHSNKCVDV